MGEIRLINALCVSNDKITEYIESFGKETIINGLTTLMEYMCIDDWKKDLLDRKCINCDSVCNVMFMVKDDKIIGAACHRENTSESGHIGYSIKPSERNKGYAKLLLKKSTDMYLANGYKEIDLLIREENEHSVKVAEHIGYELIKSYKGVYLGKETTFRKYTYKD